jgi:hypothetical protein
MVLPLPRHPRGDGVSPCVAYPDGLTVCFSDATVVLHAECPGCGLTADERDDPANATNAAMNFGEGLAEGKRAALQSLRERVEGLPVSRHVTGMPEGRRWVRLSLVLAEIDRAAE